MDIPSSSSHFTYQHISSLLPNFLPFETLSPFFTSLSQINTICYSNIPNFKLEYFIEDKDILLFKEQLRYMVNFLYKRDIDHLCESNLLSAMKQTLHITKQHQISLTKTLMLIMYSTYDIAKLTIGYNTHDAPELRKRKEKYISREYIRISLFTMKILRRLFIAGILDEDDLTALIKFKLVTAMFDRDIVHESNITSTNGSNNSLIKKHCVFVNNAPIFNCLLFITSTAIQSANGIGVVLSDEFIIETLSFFDELLLTNYTNRVKLARSYKKNQFFDIARISPRVCEKTIRILVKIYKYNFNINDLLIYTNELFFSDNIIKNVSGLNLNKNELIKLKANTLDAQVHFVKELFNSEKNDHIKSSTASSTSTTTTTSSTVHIPNGFYFTSDNKSGIFTQLQGKFPKDGYAVVVSFNLMVNELLPKKKYTIYTFTSLTTKTTLVQLYIQDNVLKLKYPNVLIDIDNVVTNCNYVFWLFHSPVGITKKYSKAVMYLNDSCYDKYGEFHYIDEKDISVTLGVCLDFQQENYNIGNFHYKSINCFQGIIGTFILFNHNLGKDTKKEKVMNLIKLKGQYEDIIHLNNNLDFWENNTSTLNTLYKPFTASNLLKYLYLIISSKSISTYSIEKNILYNNNNNPHFNSNYCYIKPEFQQTAPQIEFHCIPDIDYKNAVVYPITHSNSSKHFFNSNGIKFLLMNIYFYIMHLQTSTTPFMSNDELNANIGRIMDIFFDYWLEYVRKVETKRMSINEDIENDIVNMFYSIRILLDKTRHNNAFAISLKLLLPFSKAILQLVDYDILFKECDYLLSYDNFDKNDTDCLEYYFCSLRILITDKVEQCINDEMISKLLKFHQVYLNDNDNAAQAKRHFNTLIQAYLALALDKNKDIKYYWNKVEHYVKKIQDKSSKIYEEDDNDDNGDIKVDSGVECYMVYLYKYLKNLYIVLDDNKRWNCFLKQFKTNNNKDNNMPIHLQTPFKNFNMILKLMNDLYKTKHSYTVSSDVNHSKEMYLSELIKSVCLRFINDMLYNDKSFLPNAQCDKSEDTTQQQVNNNNNTNNEQQVQFKQRGTLRKNSLSMSNIHQHNKNQPIIMQLETEDEVVKQISSFNDLVLTPYTMRSLFLFPFRNISNKDKLKFIKTKSLTISSSPNELNLNIEPSHYIRAYLFFRIFYVSVINKLEDLDENIFCDRIDMFELCYNLFYEFITQLLNTYDKENIDKKKEHKAMFGNIFHSICYTFYYSVFKAKSITGSIVYGDDNNNNISNEHNNIAVKGEMLQKKIRSTFKELVNRTITQQNTPFYFKLLLECCPLFDMKTTPPSAVDMIKHMIYILKIDDHIINEHNNNNNNNNNNNSVSTTTTNVVVVDTLSYSTYEIIQINNCKLILIMYQLLCTYIHQKDAILNEKEIIVYLSNFAYKNEISFYKLAMPIDFNTPLHKGGLYTRTSTITSLFSRQMFFGHHNIFQKNKNTPKKFIIEIILDILIEAYKHAIINSEETKNDINDYIESFKCFIEIFIFSSPNQLMTMHSQYKHKKSMFYIIDKIHLSKKYNTYIQNERNYKEKLNLNNNSDGVNVSFTLYFLIKIIIITLELENEGNDEFSAIVTFLQNIIHQLINESELIYKKYSHLSPFNASKEYNSNIYRRVKDFVIEQISSNKHINYEDIIKIIEYYNYDKQLYLPFHVQSQSNNDQNETQSSLSISNVFAIKHQYDHSTGNLQRNRLSHNDSDIDVINDISTNKDSKLYYDEYSHHNNVNHGSSVFRFSNATHNESIDKKRNNILYKKTHASFGDNEHHHRNRTLQYLTLFDEDNNDNKQQSFININNDLLINDNNHNAHFTSLRFRRTSTKKDTFFERNELTTVPKLYSFKNDLIKTTFSVALHKYLVYNESFIKLKKIYKYIYQYDIPECLNEKHFFNYPTKYRNYTTYSYYKPFLENDLSFFNNIYFKYSHKQLRQHCNTFIPHETLPLPKFSYYNANKTSLDELSKRKELVYDVELITIKGAYYGELFMLDNCLLFISKTDPKLDKRKQYDNLDDTFACMSCLEMDFIYKEKELILFYDEIQEALVRRFLYMWIGVEVFLKNGKSYFFNLFTTKNSSLFLDQLKEKKIQTITDCKLHFRAQQYTGKWLNKKISTFDYLLLLNKYSGRSYNDVNQYPIFPWIKLLDDTMRDFKYPITLQTESKRNDFKETNVDLIGDKRYSHGNHYSTSAYVCFYLMRTNPFTHNMIKFQSNKFDEPDRQFSKIKNTLTICQKFKDNRELLPELFILPECLYNINYNDFGKQVSRNGVRVHNTIVEPFGKSPVEFVYNMRDALNNDPYVQENIRYWIDYIFGPNQVSDDPECCYYNYNTFCYEQYMNFENIYRECKKKKKNEKDIYQEIRNNVNIVLNLGQVPYQLLDQTHSMLENQTKDYNRNLNLILGESSDFDGSISDTNSNNNMMLMYANPTSKGNNNNNTNSINIKLRKVGKKIFNLKEQQDKILYFRQSHSKQLTYIITKKRDLFTLRETKLNRLYPKKFKLLIKTQDKKIPIYRVKYVFCELCEEVFVFCRYLDNVIQCIVSKSLETKYVLNSFVSSIIRINNEEFITGHQNGDIIHFRLITMKLGVKLELIKKVQSNDSAISALCYNERLNIIIIASTFEASNRKFYNFEYLNSYNIMIDDMNSQRKIIVDVKVNKIDFVYVLFNINYSDVFRIAGYTVNGLYFAKVDGKFCNFEFTKRDYIMCGFTNCSDIVIYHPVTFEKVKVFDNSIDDVTNEGMFHFWFDNCNSEIVFGLNKSPTVIMKKVIDEEELNYI